MSSALTPEIVSPPHLSDLSLKVTLNSTDERKTVFLQLLKESGGNVTRSAEAVGVTRQNAYQWRDCDAEFAELWNDAVEHGTEYLEEVAFKRAVTISDTLAIFLLKARRPEKYRENINLQGEMTLNPDELVRTFALAFERLRAQRLAEQAALSPAPDPPTE